MGSPDWQGDSLKKKSLYYGKIMYVLWKSIVCFSRVCFKQLVMTRLQQAFLKKVGVLLPSHFFIPAVN